MNFKEFFKSKTLLEFKSQDFYDFYTLAAIQKMPNIPGDLSSKKTEYDIEIEHKIIDRGNKVIDEIIDDLSFVILKRYMRASLFVDNMKEDYPETFGKFPEELQTNIGFTRQWEDNRFSDVWKNLSTKDKDNILQAAIDYTGPRISTNWGEILQYITNTKKQLPILDVNKIVYKVNELTQLVHNNGSVFEYLPNELDAALQTRDNASTAYLASIASPSVKELIRSAGIGYLGKPEKPKYLELIKTALNRAVKIDFLKNTYFQFGEVKQINSKTELLESTMVIPSFNMFKAPQEQQMYDVSQMTNNVFHYSFKYRDLQSNKAIKEMMKLKEIELKEKNQIEKFTEWADNITGQHFPDYNNDRLSKKYHSRINFYPAKIYYLAKMYNLDLSDDIKIHFTLKHIKTTAKEYRGVEISSFKIENKLFNRIAGAYGITDPTHISQYNSEDKFEYGLITFAQKGILFNLFSNLISFHQETIAPIVDSKTLYLSTENNWTI
jgi:hypothetical protein